MKNKVFASLLLLMLALLAALTLTACDDPSQQTPEPPQPPAHTHSYTEQAVAPTCTDKGFTKHSCSCGHTYEDSEVAALSHDFATYVPDNNAACGKNGTETATCSRTGCSATDTREIADSALEHSFVTYTPDNDATCLANGHETATCERAGCTVTHTREIADSKLEHSFLTYTPNNDAACGQNATETAVCEGVGCEATHTREIENSALEHDFQNYVYNNDATCQTLGTETAVCSREGCNESDTRTKADFYESHVYDQTVQGEAYFVHAADCTHKLTYYYSCACGACGTESFEVGDFAHNFVLEYTFDEMLAVPANCEHGALYYKSCECGAAGTETFEYGYPQHVYDQTVAQERYFYQAATCQKGTAYYRSCVCGVGGGYPLFYVGDPDPDNHVYNKSVTRPTKLEGGYTTYRCPCGDSYVADHTDPTGSIGLKYTTVGCEPGTCMVNGYAKYSDDNDGVIVVPAVHNGLTVVGIADATRTDRSGYPIGVFSNNTTVTKFILADTVKHLGSGAFYECDNVREIDLGNGLETIGKSPFYNCFALCHLTLPESVKSLGDNLLDGTELRSINLPASLETISRYVLGSWRTTYIYMTHTELPKTWYIDNHNNLVLGVKSFGETEDGIRWIKRADDTVLILGTNKDIPKLVIPETIDGGTVTEIADYAFRACVYNYVSGGYPQRVDYLKTVTLPDSVTLIGELAFADCQLLTTVKLPANLKTIESSAFEGCDKLTGVVFPDTLEYIGMEAFLGCTNMTKIFVPKSVTFVGQHGLATSYANGRDYLYYIESEGAPEGWHAEWYKDTGYLDIYYGASREDAS